MTDRDLIYTRALMLPPSPARTEIIEACVRIERERRLWRAVYKPLEHDVHSTCHMVVCGRLGRNSNGQRHPGPTGGHGATNRRS